MTRFWILAAVAGVLVAAAFLFGGDGGGAALPVGKYRKYASSETLERWQRDLETKQALVPPPPAPPPSDATGVANFAGTYRFGPYDYDIVIEQTGDQVVFRSAGVDHQDIGGAFETVGAGTVSDGKIRARWWCHDLSRNYANNGGCEMWFHEGDTNRLYARYYHDADEKIEEGYGVRLGAFDGEKQHYRIRIKQPVRTYKQPRVVSGTVRGRDGERLVDAVVMLRHDERSAVRTDREGRFELRLKRVPAVVMLAAAKPGYVNGVLALLLYEKRELHFVLNPSPFGDDPRYAFRDPTPDRNREIWNCGNCHKNSYAEWSKSRHALAAQNRVTRAVFERDYLKGLADGSVQGDKGLCAACHAPEAALDGKQVGLREVAGTARFGNHCDFCHKVHHTERIDAPGVFGSLALGRPSPDDDRIPGPIKRVYGALADSDYYYMGPVYNPYFTTGALCAGCHQYTTPGGVPALDTYREWQAWAGDRRAHESCQTCHMPTGTSMEGKKLARRICVNGLRRPREQIHDHSFLGRDLAPTGVELKARAVVEGGRCRVVVDIAAQSVGHKVPTGTGDKHLLLVVVATDAAGRPLRLRGGPRVPGHAGGDGDPLALDAAGFATRLAAGDFAGLAGREFAQVLADGDGRTHVPFWRAVRVVRDTRLAPGQPVQVAHLFDAPAGGVKVRVELWHRLRFKRGDVAADVVGPGRRPLDKLLASDHLTAK